MLPQRIIDKAEKLKGDYGHRSPYENHCFDWRVPLATLEPFHEEKPPAPVMRAPDACAPTIV